MQSKTREISYQAAVIILLSFLVYIAFTRPAQAAPEIYDSVTGQYLGNLSSNEFDPNSVSNKFGRYGSEFSPDSINNKFGIYGSPYSNSSVNNEFATQAPIIINRGR